MFIGAYCICLFGFGNGTLQTSNLTGAKIKEMAKEGCDRNGNGYPYPYVLLTKDGTDLEDEKEYTVVICGFSKGMEDELNQQDTGIVGLDAAKEYLKNVKEVSSGTLDDSLVKEQKKDHYVYGCCDRRKYVLHGFKEAGRIRLVDADAGADIGSLCADVPAGSG